MYNDYKNLNTKNIKTVITATATPFKFSKAVLSALLGENSINNKDEFVLLQELSEYTKLPIPKMLQDLDKKAIKKLLLYPKDKARRDLLEILKIDSVTTTLKYL